MKAPRSSTRNSTGIVNKTGEQAERPRHRSPRQLGKAPTATIIGALKLGQARASIGGEEKNVRPRKAVSPGHAPHPADYRGSLCKDCGQGKRSRESRGMESHWCFTRSTTYWKHGTGNVTWHSVGKEERYPKRNMGEHRWARETGKG
ncbi:hypothetical protein NDU88_005705 [Pleurodeles waltl]|uniref:Uncharacterized protein n=1 Tax=Pleurodeles waltl TaxID=8319 RepID=A0AAV7QJN4_PLEWA|nr:hypothetical protein NDU88_005705 [Pleurodeles waltl]